VNDKKLIERMQHRFTRRHQELKIYHTMSDFNDLTSGPWKEDEFGMI